LPVVDKGKLVGLVSSGDVVESIMSKQSNTLESLQNYIKGKYS
jgi:CBS domain-containing protein